MPKTRIWEACYSLITLSWLAFLTVIAAEGRDEEDMKQRRRMAQPWYLRQLEYGEYKFWISPLSIAILVISVTFLLKSWAGTPTFCEASHILLDSKVEDAEKQLKDMKSKISNNPVVFSKYAKKYSSCPSKSSGGSLGRFNKGDMAPPFDKACFGKSTKIGEVIGPVQTQFGWHLILVHDRQIPDELS